MAGASSSSDKSVFSCANNWLNHFMPNNKEVDALLPGEMMVTLGAKHHTKFHREMAFGGMTDDQVALVQDLLKTMAPSERLLSCFFENMLGTLSMAKSEYATQTLIDAHHMTVSASNLFQDSQLRCWWLFSAERLARRASNDSKLKGKIDWPDDAFLPNALPADINKAYSQMIKAICPWQHISALNDPIQYSAVSELAPYAWYGRMITSLDVGKLGESDFAYTLMLPPPDFRIGIDSPKNDGINRTLMVHSWIMYAAWAYFRRMVAFKCDEKDGVTQLMLPHHVFNKTILWQIIALAYGTKYQCSTRHWNDLSRDVLEEFELVEFANHLKTMK